MNKLKSIRNEYLIAIIFIILTVIFWGYSFISTKIVLKDIPPVSIAFFRQIIASAVLLIWLLSSKASLKISLKHLWLIALSGFFGIVLYFVFENTALSYTTASNASMIVAAVPVFTLITEMLFFKLKLNLKIIICILLSITGVYLVITVNGKLDFSSDTFFGNILMIGAMVAWVVYTIINKSLSDKYSSIIITAYQSMTSILLFIPFVAHEVHSWHKISISVFLNLLYLGVFCSALAYFLYIYATKRLGATVSSAFLNLIPVVSVVCGYLILDERLYLIQIVGMILIIISLFQLSKKQDRQVEESMPRMQGEMDG
jgi:drug/metabolite transporter (DMT)-like permease